MKKGLLALTAFVITLTLLMGCQGSDTKTTRFGAPEAKNTSENGTVTEGKTEAKKENTNKKLAVTSFEGGTLNTEKGYHVIQGEAPALSHRITVNDYTLTRYRPGDSHWNYIASETMGTLKAGKNRYDVTAQDAEGGILDELSFSVNYAVSPTKLPDVGAGLWVSLLLALMISGGIFGLRRIGRKREWAIL